MDYHDVYYVRPEDVADDRLILQDDEFHHLVHVKRKSEEATFLAVDGKGSAYECAIECIERSVVTARILARPELATDPNFRLTLALAIPKNNRIEWVVEKGTEIGIARFTPLISQRTVVQQKSVRRQRCARISLAAMKQSRRSTLPAVDDPMDFKSMCETLADYDVKLFAHEKNPGQGLTRIMQREAGQSQKPRSGIVCIGPEGGFTEDELELAQRAGFAVFRMGPRRLRTETAALAAAVLILERMGELN